jgi:beta-glucosidase
MTRVGRRAFLVGTQAGESKEVTVSADPRLLARFDGKTGQWRIAGGTYKIALSKSAEAPVLSAETRLQARLFGS